MRDWQPLATSGRIGGMGFLLLNILCWGAVPVLLRYLTSSMDAWTANGFRYPMAAVLYWPILYIAWKSGSLNGQVIRCCIIPSILALIGQIFWALSPYYLPASAVGFFVRFALVWSLLGAMILFQDERRLLTLGRFYVGLLLSVVGFVILSVSKLRFDAEVTATGIVIILLCGLFFGFYAVSVRRYLGGIHPLVSFGVVSQIVAAGTLVGMFTAGDYGRLAMLSERQWIVLSVSALLGIAFGHYFLYSAVERLGASITSGSQMLTPFITLILASTILGESMSGIEWFGGLTMLAGAGLLLASQHVIVSHVRDNVVEA